MNNKETPYMEMGWDNNVKNCNIDLERSIMISDDKYYSTYDALHAGVILGNLNIEDDQYQFHHCGKWYWIKFFDKADAMAFKLNWL